MTVRLGIHVARDEIHAVLLRNRDVVAMGDSPRSAESSLGDQLETLFATLPGMNGRTPLTVALDPPAAWSKTITELPALEQPRAREQVVLENADQYFIGDLSSRVIAVKAVAAGVMADSYDAQVIADLCAASPGLSHRLRIVAARRVERGEGEGIDQRYAIAAGAATFDPTTAPSYSLAGRALAPEWRRRGAIAALVCAAAFALVSPLLRYRRHAEATRREIGAVAAAYGAASRTARDIDRLTEKMRTVNAGRGLPSVGSILSQITSALPKNSALVAFAFDTLKGSVVIVSSSVVNALPALDGVTSIASARLSGPITRERIGNRELERATVVLTWRSAP